MGIPGNVPGEAPSGMPVSGEKRQNTLLPEVAGPLRVEPIAGHPAIGLSIVVPTFNELANIAVIVERLSTVLNGVAGLSYEIIVVDDDSSDGTWQRALELTDTYPQLRVLRRQSERGLATAVIRGWQLARGQVLGVIDADLQHPPETAARLWEAISGGADLAVATRHAPGGGVSDWSVWRRMVSRGAQGIGLILLPDVLGRVRDPMSGYLMVRRSALEGREMNPLGYKILIEVLARGRIREIREVPYVFIERTQGASKATLKVYREYLQQLLRLRIDLLKHPRE